MFWRYREPYVIITSTEQRMANAGAWEGCGRGGSAYTSSGEQLAAARVGGVKGGNLSRGPQNFFIFCLVLRSEEVLVVRSEEMVVLLRTTRCGKAFGVLQRSTKS